MDVQSLLPALLLAIGCIAYIFWPQKKIAAPTRQRESLEGEAAGVISEMESLGG